MGGRPPKPIAQHKRDGSYRADRHGDRLEAQFVSGMPEKPSDLRPDASRLWDDIVATFPSDALSTIDWAGLEECVRAFSTAAVYRSIIDEDPLEFKAFSCWARASQMFLSYASRFGLTPADRAKLRAPPKESTDDDPMTALLKITAKRTG